MQVAVWIVLAAIVAFVAFDARGRTEPPRRGDRDRSLISTQKIIVDLTKRR